MQRTAEAGPGADKPGAGARAPDKPGEGTNGPDKPGGGAQDPDMQNRDKQGAEKQTAEKQTAERQPAERQTAERQTAERPGALSASALSAAAHGVGREGGSEKRVEFDRMGSLMAVVGQYDSNLKLIEERLGVRAVLRDGAICIAGDDFMTDRAALVIRQMIDMADRGEEVSRRQAIHLLNMAAEDRLDEIGDSRDPVICTTVKGRQIKAKTQGQRNYVKAVSDNTITFCVGPAGTGKTYLAVAMAVNAFKNKITDRIILTRPAVEAGEKLGFLPGDLQNKVDPYLRPLYDALYETMGPESYQRYFEKGMIEIAPLAYMRGRTLDNSFIILDEAQNTTFEQMKMFLTRIGFGSKAVVTGDITQVDLPDDKKPGLREVIKILGDIDDIKFIYLTEKDVVRHELVRKIIKAYEEYEKSRKNKPDRAVRRRPGPYMR